jgi:hypothetical protein
VTRCDVAARYGARLLGRSAPLRDEAPRHPALEWARSGAMELTGHCDGPPLLAPGPLASCARGALLALRELAARIPEELDGAALLGERAAIVGLRRRGATAPGGTCRLLRAADRWIAVSLPRESDLELLPAWLGAGSLSDPWELAAERVRRRPARELVDRARLLGLAAAVAGPPPPAAPPWVRVDALGEPRRRRGEPPLVADLSSLWAGPLCAHLLLLAGARVVKVESVERPDGARGGPPALLDLLHAGKPSVALPLATRSGREALRALVARADLVIESSRPRALVQLGIDAEELVRSSNGLTWVSITGYGRRDPEGSRVAFGDDAAVAAGLAVATGSEEEPLFCGDAIADPLAGLHAAVAALASHRAGGGRLVDVALRDVAAHALLFDGGGCRDARVRGRGGGFEVEAGGRREAVRPPRARRPAGRARSLGADSAAVLAELGIRC